MLIHHEIDCCRWDPIIISNKGPHLSHIFFTDDLILLVEANQKNCNSIIDTLHKFYNYSGQTINFQKSKIIFSNNTTLEKKEDISQCISMRYSNKVGKYLKFLIMNSNPSKRELQYIIDHLNSRLRGRKINHMNIVGRTTLIKATLVAIPIHVMQIFSLPKATPKYIDTIQRNFLCGSTLEKRKCHLIKWDTVTRSKNEGELGLYKSK